MRVLLDAMPPDENPTRKIRGSAGGDPGHCRGVVPRLEQVALGVRVLSAQRVHRCGGVGDDARPPLFPLALSAFHFCSRADDSAGELQQPFWFVVIPAASPIGYGL